MHDRKAEKKAEMTRTNRRGIMWSAGRGRSPGFGRFFSAHIQNIQS